MPDNLTQYRAAVADLESKIATATLAAQTHRCLIERAESGEPVPDEELAETAQIARQTAQDVATAEDVARGHRNAVPEPKPATDKPRRLRVVSAIGALAWREKILSMPQELARARGLDPYSPPLMAREEM